MLKMVCKEEICNWFRYTQSYERIDLLCKLLHLCSSHEIRFIASIVEDQARKDYSALRDSAFKANEVSELKKLCPDLFKPPDRSNLLVYLSLLDSANTTCAHVLFTMLTRVESQRLECHLHSKHNPGKEPPPGVGQMDNDTADDVILLYTMAAYHPAFTITQRLQLSDYLQKAQSSLADYLSKPEIPEYNRDVHTSTSSNRNPGKSMNQINRCHLSQHSCQSQNSAIKNPVYVKKIEYKHCQWDMYSQCHVLHIQVTMSSGEVRDINRTYQQLSDFSIKLSDLFSVDADHRIPYLRQEHEGNSSIDEKHISSYIRKLSELPDRILHSDYVRAFFDGSQFLCDDLVGSEARDLYKASNHESLEMYHCLSVPTAHATSTVVQQRISYSSVVVSPLPHHSPLPSPLPSPHISPSQHMSAAAKQIATEEIATWLKNVRLHKYQSLSGFSWHELSQLDSNDLEKIGLTDGAKNRFRKELETQLQKIDAVSSKNGVVNPLRVRQDSAQSSNSVHSQSSQLGCTPTPSPTPNSICENHTQVHLPLTIVTKVSCSPSITNGMNSANSIGSCSGLSDCSGVTPPSSPQSQGSLSSVCTSSQQMVVPPADCPKQFTTETGEENDEGTAAVANDVMISPARQGNAVPNIAEVRPFSKTVPVSEGHIQIVYPCTPDCTAESNMPLGGQRVPQVVPIRIPTPTEKGMPLTLNSYGIRPRKPMSTPHIRSPRLQSNSNQFVAPLLPLPPATAATQTVGMPHNGFVDPAHHGLLITKPGGTQPSQMSPEVTPCISNITGESGKPPVNYSILPAPHQGLIPCMPSGMGPAPGCHIVQRPTALAIPSTSCVTYNSITTPTVVTTMLDKPSPILLPTANIPPPISTSDANVPYQNTASCNVTFTTRTAFTPAVPSPGSNQSGSSLLSTPTSSLTPQPLGNNSITSVAMSPPTGLVHPTTTQTPTTVPTPVPQSLALPHNTASQSECGCPNCQQHTSHSPQPPQHPAPIQTIPTTVPFNFQLQHQQQSVGWPQGPVYPGSYQLPSGFVPVSSNGMVNPSISFPIFNPHVPHSLITNLPPEALYDTRSYALIQAGNQSLQHPFHNQPHFPLLPAYATGVPLPGHNSKPKSAMCSNCGSHGHMAFDCEAPTIEAFSRAHFCLKMQPRSETD